MKHRYHDILNAETFFSATSLLLLRMKSYHSFNIWKSNIVGVTRLALFEEAYVSTLNWVHAQKHLGLECLEL